MNHCLFSWKICSMKILLLLPYYLETVHLTKCIWIGQNIVKPTKIDFTSNAVVTVHYFPVRVTDPPFLSTRFYVSLFRPTNSMLFPKRHCFGSVYICPRACICKPSCRIRSEKHDKSSPRRSCFTFRERNE